jgi:G:T/U-mismatch repair DNA glycosylase
VNWIAKQPYYKVERKVEGSEQTTVTDHREMVLYPDKLVTRNRAFPVADVFDASYRHMGGTDGMLYLYTSQGVFSYTLKDRPDAFIAAFKQLKTQW